MSRRKRRGVRRNTTRARNMRKHHDACAVGAPCSNGIQRRAKRRHWRAPHIER